jgi:2'-5' RNA ligase
MRLFIAIGLPPDVSESLARVRTRFESSAGPVPSRPALRWSAPEGWHITLQFLGQVDEQQAACVLENLQAIRATRVPIRVDGLGFFERAGVFWAGVPLTPELLALQQFVTAAMLNCGFVPESRPYSPHITLARAKGRAGPRTLAPLKKAVDQARATLRASFTAEEFLLYESFPGPEGSRYEVRARFPLSPMHNL